MSKRRPRSNTKENAVIRAIDELAEYDTFQQEIAPILRQAISEGWSANRIENDPKIKALLVARQLSIALLGNGKNIGAALSAITDHRNRVDGKAVDKREIKMSLEASSDEALDAKLQALLNSSTEDDNASDTH